MQLFLLCKPFEVNGHKIYDHIRNCDAIIDFEGMGTHMNITPTSAFLSSAFIYKMFFAKHILYPRFEAVSVFLDTQTGCV